MRGVIPVQEAWKTCKTTLGGYGWREKVRVTSGGGSEDSLLKGREENEMGVSLILGGVGWPFRFTRKGIPGKTRSGAGDPRRSEARKEFVLKGKGVGCLDRADRVIKVRGGHGLRAKEREVSGGTAMVLTSEGGELKQGKLVYQVETQIRRGEGRN